MKRPLVDAVHVMRGRLRGEAGASVSYRGAAIDSRQVQGGELFFALPGEQTDGHRFVGAALAAGAAAAVVTETVADVEGAQIRVANVMAALHDLTRHHRRLLPIRVAAITGSAGKTTTKDLLALLLGARFRVAKSPGNLNNLLGFPITLLAVDEDREWLVAEMGMSLPGELAEVSRLGRPDVAVFTNVRPAHLAGFEQGPGSGGLEAIARAKAELLEGLAEDGLIVANAGDRRVVGLVERYLAERGRRTDSGGSGHVVWYELEPSATSRAEIRAYDLAPLTGRPGTRFTLDWHGSSTPIELPLHGRVNVANFLAAAAAALRLGVPLAALPDRARRLRPGSGRGEVLALSSGATLVDDSYNSNPEAARLALEAARLLPGGRHVAVLGEMLELGRGERCYHRELGAAAALLGFDLVVGVGKLAEDIVGAAAAAGAETMWFEDAVSAAAEAPGLIQANDVVLVKGSRGAALEHVVGSLVAKGAN